MKSMIKSALLLLSLLLPATAAAYDFEVDGIYYNIYGNEASVTNGNNYGDWECGSYSGDVTIPETVTYEGMTYSVKSIDFTAFANCDGLTSVSIPNSVTSIGNDAFYGCTDLTSINIPNSVIIIDGNTFRDCSSLKSIIVDSGNPKYDSRDNCNAIIETASNTLIAGCMGTVIPNSVTTIDHFAFQLCPGLTSVSIPNSVTTIGEMAFSFCGSLTSVNIGNSVSEIGAWAFVYCSNLMSIIVDSGNSKYDSRDNCNAIIESASNSLIAGCMGTVIPSSVISIGNGAFSYCTGLTSVSIPNSVTSIGNSAFLGCTGLTNINIPNSVTTIDDYAFIDCCSLTSVDIPNSITAISDGVFGGCSNLTNVTIPNSVTSIGGGAFNSSGLKSVIIPNSVTHIGDGAFNRCWALIDVYSYITNFSKVTCGDWVFGDDSDFDYSGRTLHVPQGTAAAYQADENWYPYFGQIVEDLMPDNLPGDVNGDGAVDISDVNMVTSIILGVAHDANIMRRADVNRDGSINISDINAIIAIILRGDEEQEHEWVDLGLPSGTLWATCNVGANSPEEYGDYFAWGETAPKQVYSWETYKWCEGSDRTMTKYCIKSSYGTVDNKTELEPEDDAAFANWGPSWRMPSAEQIKELIDNCSSQWTMVNGVNGLMITGPNGNTVFLPATDCLHYDYPNPEGSYVNYWSRTLDSDMNFFAPLMGGSTENEWNLYYGYRDYGITVRPVRVSKN